MQVKYFGIKMNQQSFIKLLTRLLKLLKDQIIYKLRNNLLTCKNQLIFNNPNQSQKLLSTIKNLLQKHNLCQLELAKFLNLLRRL